MNRYHPQNAFVQTDSGNGVNQGKQQIVGYNSHFWILKKPKACLSGRFLIPHQVSNQSYLYVFLVIGEILGFMECSSL